MQQLRELTAHTAHMGFLQGTDFIEILEVAQSKAVLLVGSF